MQDCKTCKHSTVLYRREKGDKFTTAYSPVGYVRCAAPRYKGRAYFRKDTSRDCAEYSAKERGSVNE